MIVPQYWSEAILKNRINGRLVTIKRFGWSDTSEAEAKLHAESRANEALAHIEAGQNIQRFERKLPYNGADGLPIREEIISRHNDSVITRNSYGALCINTPDVLFADVDFRKGPAFIHYIVCLVLLLGAAISTGWLLDSARILAAASIGAIALVFPLTQGLHGWLGLFNGGVQGKALQQIKRFSATHPEWHLRVYRTPAGYRILVMHKTFDPVAQETLDFFQALHTDPIYVQMCKNQRCFRARVSPKPWRIGIESHLKPRPGTWPIKAERMADRKKWVMNYERVARQFASCRFEEQMGSQKVDPKANYIRLIHDDLCQADTQLQLA